MTYVSNSNQETASARVVPKRLLRGSITITSSEAASSLSPSEEEEDNRVAVIKYESERGDGGERETERGASSKFSQVQMEGGNRKGARGARDASQLRRGAGAADSFQQQQVEE